MLKVRRRLTYANVMATLAVFIALGGSATAAVIITSNDEVAPDTISGHNPPAGAHSNLISNSVSQDDLAPDAQTCRTPGVLSLATGDPFIRICRSGKLSLRAGCRVSQGSRTSGQFVMRTGQMTRSHWVSLVRPVLALPKGSLSSGSRRCRRGTPLEEPPCSPARPMGASSPGRLEVGSRNRARDGTGTCEFVVGASK